MTPGFETSNRQAGPEELHNRMHDQVHGQLSDLRSKIDVGQMGKQIEDLKENFVDKIVDGFGDKLSGLPGLLEKAKAMNIKIPQWLAFAVTYCANQPKAVAATIKGTLGMDIDIARELQNGVAADKMLEAIAKKAKELNPAAKDPLKEALLRVVPKPKTLTELAAAVAKLPKIVPAPQPATAVAAAPATTPAPAQTPASDTKTA